jgi:hypothetical protein
MDFKEIFKGISKKLLIDFNNSAQIQHGTDKGTFRENALKDFLGNGRLPKKYTLGHGQIITRKNDMSKSIDIVIHDNINFSPLLYDENTQIFPIESVYGVIECKSKLSKEKLEEGLENIKSVKSIAPKDRAYRKDVHGTTTYQRPTPFGIIFAYSLGNNSLASLEKNILEWEKNNDPKLWPNLVVILNEGIITHRNYDNFKDIIFNNEITEETIPNSIGYKEDSLFKFYIILMDLCASMFLGNFHLLGYFNLPEHVGEFYVKGMENFTNKETGNKARFKIEFLKKVYNYCDNNSKSNYIDICIKGIGNFPPTWDEKEYSQIEAYLYNPNNYPGLHEVNDAVKFTEGKAPKIVKNVCFPCIELEINEKIVFIPYSYIKDECWEQEN